MLISIKENNVALSYVILHFHKTMSSSFITCISLYTMKFLHNMIIFFINIKSQHSMKLSNNDLDEIKVT